MTDEELDQWRGREAWRLQPEYPEEAIEVIAARLAREGRTPPEPVDPDLLAFREWFADLWNAYAEVLPGRSAKSIILEGASDNTEQAAAFLAGARMAREQEQERAKVLDQAKAIIDQHARLLARLPLGLRADMGIEWQTMMDATASFYAKYQGEA